MLYIGLNLYQSNTSPTNRVLSLVRGFSELGIEAEVFPLLQTQKGV